MLRSFSKEELLSRWRLVRYLEPQRNDVTMEYDGGDMSALDEAELEQWWERTIDTAPLDWLKLTEMKDKATVLESKSDGCVEVTMPIEFPLRRIGKVRLNGWNRDGRIVRSGSVESWLQLNRYSRGTADDPVAVVTDDWNLSLFPASSTTLESLQCVDAGDYTMDVRCLGTMKDGCI